MKFEKNVGKKDRAIRLIIAALLVIATIAGFIPAQFGLIVLIVAAALALSAAMSFCGLYTLLGKSTCCGTCQKDDKGSKKA